jgi:hypothetical protein
MFLMSLIMFCFDSKEKRKSRQRELLRFQGREVFWRGDPRDFSASGKRLHGKDGPRANPFQKSGRFYFEMVLRRMNTATPTG